MQPPPAEPGAVSLPAPLPPVGPEYLGCVRHERYERPVHLDLCSDLAGVRSTRYEIRGAFADLVAIHLRQLGHTVVQAAGHHTPITEVDGVQVRGRYCSTSGSRPRLAPYKRRGFGAMLQCDVVVPAGPRGAAGPRYIVATVCGKRIARSKHRNVQPSRVAHAFHARFSAFADLVRQANATQAAEAAADKLADELNEQAPRDVNFSGYLDGRLHINITVPHEHAARALLGWISAEQQALGLVPRARCPQCGKASGWDAEAQECASCAAAAGSSSEDPEPCGEQPTQSGGQMLCQTCAHACKSGAEEPCQSCLARGSHALWEPLVAAPQAAQPASPKRVSLPVLQQQHQQQGAESAVSAVARLCETCLHRGTTREADPCKSCLARPGHSCWKPRQSGADAQPRERLCADCVFEATVAHDEPCRTCLAGEPDFPEWTPRQEFLDPLPAAAAAAAPEAQPEPQAASAEPERRCVSCAHCWTPANRDPCKSCVAKPGATNRFWQPPLTTDLPAAPPGAALAPESQRRCSTCSHSATNAEAEPCARCYSGTMHWWKPQLQPKASQTIRACATCATCAHCDTDVSRRPCSECYGTESLLDYEAARTLPPLPAACDISCSTCRYRDFMAQQEPCRACRERDAGDYALWRPTRQGSAPEAGAPSPRSTLLPETLADESMFDFDIDDGGTGDTKR